MFRNAATTLDRRRGNLHEQQQQHGSSSSNNKQSSTAAAAAARSKRGRSTSSTLFQDEVFINITPHIVSAHHALGCGGFLRVNGCSETPSQLALGYETVRWAGLVLRVLCRADSQAPPPPERPPPHSPASVPSEHADYSNRRGSVHPCTSVREGGEGGKGIQRGGGLDAR